MDHTITWANSGLSSVKFARKHGLVPASHLVKSIFKIILYRLSLLDIEQWYEKNMAMLSGTSLKDMDRFCSLWFEEMMKKTIYREAAELILSHRDRGHRVAVISNSPRFFVKPVADALSITDMICTEVEAKDGVLTGRLVKPLCYGEGKRVYAIRWAGLNGIDLSQSYFYTDSFFDIPLMKTVGHPVATNPDMRLRRAALAYGWPILTFARMGAFE
ncbi:MAG: HAD family hydrolase [Desulfomonilia bacterium]|uniref:Phosphoserine phosphatase n=1 Tax=anaerobic digester metagenome TaxID=1263854 RepID=A0A485M715_9ZZZZ|nr:HAD family hydrolase [Deltaproteobacteria bacterium]HPD21162.1 HAD family hydrolase [Deltaproteobacteria bacterium]HPX18129.1 HAD family hydrolase [Deltaproteobacteria bacterium]HRS56161.1 HAD family hydrolase [Desulfomonilia bacterium]HRV35923.1 HAD family hydrolase [Desulfomonilia bacterium]